MVPAVSHVVLVSQVYLASSFCPILFLPFLPLKDIAKCPVVLVLRLGQKPRSSSSPSKVRWRMSTGLGMPRSSWRISMLKACMWQLAQPKAIWRTWWNSPKVSEGGRERKRVIIGSSDRVMATWTR